jgi:ADP-ribosylglycohydrolase
MESELTHPNKLVGEITGIYCVIIADILRNKNVNILSEVPNYIQNDKILQWFQLALKLENLETYDCVVNEGHVKHAFVFVIYFLRHIHEYTFERAIIEVLQCGGDTDTNAKIVGNLFGAFYGDCVPSYLSDAVLQFDCTTVESKFYKRPFQCSVKYAIELLQN